MPDTQKPENNPSEVSQSDLIAEALKKRRENMKLDEDLEEIEEIIEIIEEEEIEAETTASIEKPQASMPHQPFPMQAMLDQVNEKLASSAIMAEKSLELDEENTWDDEEEVLSAVSAPVSSIVAPSLEVVNALIQDEKLAESKAEAIKVAAEEETKVAQTMQVNPEAEAVEPALKLEVPKPELKVEAPQLPKLQAPKVPAPQVEASKVETPKVEAPKPAPKIDPAQLQAAKLKLKTPQLQPKPVAAQQVAPAAEKKGKVAALRDFFSKVTHPYGKVGGNLAGNQAINRPAVAAPAPAPMPKPQMVQPAVIAKPAPAKTPAKSSQLQQQLDSDHLLAKKLQAEFDREAAAHQQQVEDDYLLAAKMQIEDEVKSGIELPSKEQLNRPALNKVGSDIYNRRLADMFRALQLKPSMPMPAAKPSQVEAEAPKAAPKAKLENNQHPLNNVAMLVLINTYSLQLAMTANGFVMREVRQAMFIGLTMDNKNGLNVHMAMAAQQNDLAVNKKGLFANSMFTQGQASFKLQPGERASFKLPQDDQESVSISRPGVKSR